MLTKPPTTPARHTTTPDRTRFAVVAPPVNGSGLVGRLTVPLVPLVGGGKLMVGPELGVITPVPVLVLVLGVITPVSVLVLVLVA